LYVKLAEPRLNTVGLKLSIGAFKSDFPRGLRVSTFKSCPTINDFQFTPHSDKIELFKANPWQGTIEFTQAGLPYFAPQTRVIARFKSALDLQCLLIEQLGIDPHYDWSIAEMYTLH
jgi:hypothetical protein